MRYICVLSRPRSFPYQNFLIFQSPREELHFTWFLPRWDRSVPQWFGNILKKISILLHNGNYNYQPTISREQISKYLIVSVQSLLDQKDIWQQYSIVRSNISIYCLWFLNTNKNYIMTTPTYHCIRYWWRMIFIV